MCLLATFETVAQLQLVSTVKALKVLLLTAHILRLPKDINKDKYFTVNRINNALRPRETRREAGVILFVDSSPPSALKLCLENSPSRSCQEF